MYWKSNQTSFSFNKKTNPEKDGRKVLFVQF